MIELRTLQDIRLRGLKLFVVTLLLIGVVLVPSSFAQLGEDRDISGGPGPSSCPVDRSASPPVTRVPEDGFTDVPSQNVHEFAIDCVVWYNIILGTSSSTYHPGAPVTRGQMTSFIARMLDYAAEVEHAGPDGFGRALPGAPAANQFPCDVDPASIHYENVQRLAAAGIVQGTGTNVDGEACFDPGVPVTRAQMATFLTKAEGYPDNTEGAVFDFDPFVDDEGNIHEDAINLIASRGITQGAGLSPSGEHLYRPEQPVQRDQMGSFLARTLDVLAQEGKIVPPPGP